MSWRVKHFKVNFRPVSLTDAETAEMHAGQSSINVQSEIASPKPKVKSGISIAIVAATFSFAIKPQRTE